MTVARKRKDPNANPVFRVSEWPTAHFARIERQHQRNAAHVLAPHGLHHREWRMLAIIDEMGVAGVTPLAERAVIERSTIGKLLVRLEEKGLVKRVVAGDDSRANPVELTARGRALLAKSVSLIRGLFEQYRKEMTAADYAALMKLTAQFRLGVERVAALQQQTKRDIEDE
jgi:DNA-binding MarR family transcriptional regulator